MAGLIFALVIFVVTIVCYIQIITKAGYSPWWILLPLSLPVLWLITIADISHGFSEAFGTFGFVDPQAIADQAKALGWLIFFDGIANYVMLVIFAFSDWPVIQAARSRHSGGGGGIARPPQRPAAPASASVGGPDAAPGALDLEGQPAGWYKSGPVGAGEQSYWDGSALTARRQWSGGDWVDLPLEQPQPVGSEGTPAPAD